MKTLILTAAAIITFTFSSKADDNTKTAKNNSAEALSAGIAPMVVGNPGEEAPAGLEYLLANPSTVPAAPVFAGSPGEAPAGLEYLLANPSAVPAAPVWAGNADEAAPGGLNNILAYPGQVPVAPMVIGNPDEEAPIELGSMPAYRAN